MNSLCLLSTFRVYNKLIPPPAADLDILFYYINVSINNEITYLDPYLIKLIS
jgi:hypothetical protein